MERHLCNTHGQSSKTKLVTNGTIPVFLKQYIAYARSTEKAWKENFAYKKKEYNIEKWRHIINTSLKIIVTIIDC